MLHVLTAQILADEREQAIQHRLRGLAVLREAMTARAARRAASPRPQDSAARTPGELGRACPPAAGAR